MSLTQLEYAIEKFLPIMAWHLSLGWVEYLCATEAIINPNGTVSARLLDKNRKTTVVASLENIKIKEK